MVNSYIYTLPQQKIKLTQKKTPANQNFTGIHGENLDASDAPDTEQRRPHRREAWPTSSYLVSVQYLQEGPVDFRVVQKAGLNFVHVADGIVEFHGIGLQGHLGLVLLVQRLLLHALRTVAVAVRVLLATGQQ